MQKPEKAGGRLDDDVGDANGEKESQEVNPRDKERHLKNAYRVLLTRARQGMIIFIPKGEESQDSNLWKGNYDTTYTYLHDEVEIPDLNDVFRWTEKGWVRK
jgi:DUF2075 family protein